MSFIKPIKNIPSYPISKPTKLFVVNAELKRKNLNTSVNWPIFVEVLTILQTKRYIPNEKKENNATDTMLL